MYEIHNWKSSLAVWKYTSSVGVFEFNKTCISMMGRHDTEKKCPGKDQQFIIMYPTDNALRWRFWLSPGKLKSLPTYFYCDLKRIQYNYLTVHKTKIAKENETFK